jgi:hypothetical protein
MQRLPNKENTKHHRRPYHTTKNTLTPIMAARKARPSFAWWMVIRFLSVQAHHEGYGRQIRGRERGHSCSLGIWLLSLRSSALHIVSARSFIRRFQGRRFIIIFRHCDVRSKHFGLYCLCSPLNSHDHITTSSC